jgi:ABC-type polysaccharide/polyol phosphate export permease
MMQHFSIISLYNWSYLAWSDIQARYRRSSLGVFWITLTTLISSVAIAYVYSSIFNVRFQDYLPYITLGICLWSFIATCLNEITSSLIQNRQLLLGRKIEPYWIWYRITVRNIIVLAHSLLIVLPILWLFDGSLSVTSLAISLAGILLVSCILFLFGGLLSILSVRYGDVPQAISALIGLAFLVTPVLWDVKVLGTKENHLVDFNLFHHMISAMRSPLLGQETSLSSWYILTVTALIGALILNYLVKNFRKSYMPWL